MAGDRDTEFASAERSDEQALYDQITLLESVEWVRPLYDAVNDLVVILNAQRQIVFFNQSFARFLGDRDASDLLGLRPGEALRCARAACPEAHGCGTTRFCSACGAVQAILASQHGRPDRRECRILLQDGSALDLLVKATPLSLNGETYVVCALTDISPEQRPRPLALRSVEFLQDLLDGYRHYEAVSTGALRLDPAVQDVPFEGDGQGLRRVLGAVLQSALEACPFGGVVTVGCEPDGQSVLFRVHNPGVMPHDAQQQIFQRSFPTQGPGRGLGTYSMKLLIERDLGGQIDFTTSKDHGTTFTLRCPLKA